MKRIFLIVLDSCGIGEEPDAAEFGDVGSNTLRACAASPEFDMRNLISYGLGDLDGVDYMLSRQMIKVIKLRKINI